jgi:UDP-GlcNAc:undecaprenyl-phosphate GlcNAc-1-phosphate transferase
MEQQLMYTIAMVTGMSFIFNVLGIPFIIYLSHRFHWFDRLDHRKIHEGNIPRLAGIGIVVSFFLSLILSSVLFNFNILPYLPFISAVLLAALIGLIDDFVNVRPRYKLLFQITAASIILLSGYFFREIAIPFTNLTIQLSWAGPILTFFWIIGASNAVNLIDGLDGLAGGVSFFASLGLVLISLSIGSMNTMVIAAALCGSLLGFLVFNFPPARIFMGDSGSLFLGFSLAVIPLLLEETIPGLVFIIAVTLLLIPVMDTLAAMLRRIRKRMPIHHPDKNHLHHKFLDLGLSVRAILGIVYATMLMVVFSVWTLVLFTDHRGYIFVLSAWILVTGLFLGMHYLTRMRNSS